MKTKNIVLASLALVAVMLSSSMAFAECCDCSIMDVKVETTYSGSGQYCMQTYAPAGEGNTFVDSIGANAESYSGYQYVYTNGKSAMGYDIATASNGNISNHQSSYYQNGNHSVVTVYGTCATGNGTIGALVYMSGNVSYGSLAAYGTGFVCIDFSQLSDLNGNFDYYLNQGAGSSDGGNVSALYYSNQNDNWGYETMSSGNGLYWTDIETTQSIDACDVFTTDWMTNAMNLSNNGTVSLLKSINTSGNSTYMYRDIMNPRTTTTSTSTTTSTTTEETTTTVDGD